MRESPPKERATSPVTHIRGFGQSRGLLVANCQLVAEICYTLIRCAVTSTLRNCPAHSALYSSRSSCTSPRSVSGTPSQWTSGLVYVFSGGWGGGCPLSILFSPLWPVLTFLVELASPGRPRSDRPSTRRPPTCGNPPCARRDRRRRWLSPVTARKMWKTMTARDYGDAVTFLRCSSSACRLGNVGVGHFEQSPIGSPRWHEKLRPIILAERRQWRVRICHREKRRRIPRLIHQSRPFVVTSRKKGIGPRWDPLYRLARKIYQWTRRSEENPWSTRGSPCRSDRWGHRGCTRRHTGGDLVQLWAVGRRHHRWGRAVIDDWPTQRSTSSWNQQTSRQPGNWLPVHAWQRPESPAAPPEMVAVLGTTSLVCRPAEVTSWSARSVEGTGPEIDPQPNLPSTKGESHGKAQGKIWVQRIVCFIKRPRGRRPRCQ